VPEKIPGLKFALIPEKRVSRHKPSSVKTEKNRPLDAAQDKP
jgi:hypothetical protein